jgi:hypothetical protein
MNLTEQILEIILAMRAAFFQERSFRKFLTIIFAILCTAGRHTITSFIFFAKQEAKDWSKMYRFFSKNKWNPTVCFDEITKLALAKVFEKHGDVVIALDDFRVEKTGKTIPHTRYQLDPKSPPFHPNLMWGHRYLHATLVMYRKKRGSWKAAKSISIRIKLAPHIKKPGKKATEQDWETYQAAKKENNLCRYASGMIQELRKLLDQLGYTDKVIKIVADGGYCNKTIFGNLPDRVDLIARCRKDAKLCFRAGTRRNFYGKKTFTPYDIYKDEETNSKTAQLYYGRKISEIKYKERWWVYWQRGAKKCPLRSIVVYGVKYRRNKNGYTNYREPMYLLTTNLTLRTPTLIQFYFYRWEIEVTHRELKNNLGVCQAQVWNETSVERCPQVIALANSIMHLAHVMLEEKDEEKYLPAPKWDKKRKRISLEYLRKRLRKEVVENQAYQWILNLNLSWKDIFERIAA